MSEPIIRLKKLNITFDDRVIIDGIDLDVERGKTLAILGPSGSGKSTILKTMIGLLIPTSGDVFVKDKLVNNLNEDEWNMLRQKMGMVFQYSALFDFLTVAENVAFGLRQHTKKSNEEIEEIIDEMLNLVGMPNSKNQYPSELSGGMQKRVGLARAIAVKPEIVLYDEPTAGLDPIMSNNISRLIKKTQEKLKVTSVLVTHDMESAFYVADYIAMLYKGKIVACDSVDAIKNSSNEIVQAFIHGREIKEEGV